MRKLLFLLLFPFGALSAQEWKTTSNQDSTFVVVRESRFDQVVERQRNDNLSHPAMPGYRVQIYFGVNRQKANEVKQDFLTRFPEVPAYLSYQQPNYKVRVGDFPNRYAAFDFLKRIEGTFPTMFVVPDEIRIPPISAEGNDAGGKDQQ